MTRDEALRLLNKHNDDDVASVEVIKQFINQVFDDFESRTCENCKYSEYDNEKFGEENESNWLRCWNELLHTICGRCVDVDFGCNKFEKKDEK